MVRQKDGKQSVEMPAMHAIKLVERFVLGHEFGHHMAHGSTSAKKYIAAVQEILEVKLFESLKGTNKKIHAIVKPSAEYIFDGEGNLRKHSSRGLQLEGALGNINKAACEELVADHFGIFYVTHYACAHQLSPGWVLQTLMGLMEDLLIDQLLTNLVCQAPRIKEGGMVTFPYTRYAYRLTSFVDLIQATLARPWAGQAASTAFAKYWGGKQGKEALKTMGMHAKHRAEVFDQLDIIVRGGLMHAVLPTVPIIPPYPEYFDRLPPELLGTQTWLLAPFSVPASLYNEDCIFGFEQFEDIDPVYLAVASAAKKIAQGMWSPATVHARHGIEYCQMGSTRSMTGCFRMIRQPRVDVMQGSSSFQELDFSTLEFS